MKPNESETQQPKIESIVDTLKKLTSVLENLKKILGEEEERINHDDITACYGCVISMALNADVAYMLARKHINNK